ncbi:Hypothetical protein Minf_0551 [Methylacidiphilum infernorum V4]|uniref:Uncharacterized protein n=1 Tax=Methylacidiphilum infernorum (isolate V4) TaxID=481448 RepID=B3DZJ2_METI4|nr:Hypothetical protein Minf_0551 [Methylacidiphilum infernorum V4]
MLLKQNKVYQMKVYDQSIEINYPINEIAVGFLQKIIDNQVI